MSEQISEQISALLDGELPEAELSLLLRQIERQPSVLEHAYRVQQAHLCSQGEAPIGLTHSINLSTRIHAAIRQQDVVQNEENLEKAAFGLQNTNATFNQTSLTNALPNNKLVASNDSRWRPLMGAGIAAAVALVAVNAWQFQSQNPASSNPAMLEVENTEFSKFDSTQKLQPVANNLSAASLKSENNSYTVPNFENINTETPIVSANDFRQVGYSDNLLQNNIAPQSTSKQLLRFAQEQRATIYQEQIYIDPRSGQIVLSIKPILE